MCCKCIESIFLKLYCSNYYNFYRNVNQYLSVLILYDLQIIYKYSVNSLVVRVFFYGIKYNMQGFLKVKKKNKKKKKEKKFIVLYFIFLC